eukprot:Plantae.Rhodophyta-Hildenbrandia_rubra.ctg6613.p1 GENE.Plantae.Rhodophyta-Hildenbrandia_rubra.ctg6613~~Plantae.Rhodophyta-Hildenbrandia_rubra.ctg6613.p1  ORF type:complete len:122 (-),score=13.71 Plantae.Rhodophyta-Hildenbrandia_rubra.ctg6613:623-988(-)
MSVGRSAHGFACSALDALLGAGKSTLFLGQPCSGKTAAIRAAACALADSANACIADTSNEIAGDSIAPHPCIGEAREMMRAPTFDQQSSVMIEAAQSHSPSVMALGEIGRPKEVNAARAVK